MPEVKSVLSVREVADAMGISRPLAYRLVRRPDFPAFSLGRRLIVPRAQFEIWLADQARKGAVL